MAKPSQRLAARCIQRYVVNQSKKQLVEIAISEYGLPFVRSRIMNGDGNPDWSDWQYSIQVANQIPNFGDDPDSDDILAQLPTLLKVTRWVGDPKYPAEERVMQKMHGMDFYAARLRLPRYKTEAPDPAAKRKGASHIPLENEPDDSTD